MQEENDTVNKKRKESYKKTTACCISKEKFEDKYPKNKKYRKAKDHYHYTGKNKGTAHSICDLKYSVTKEIPVFFHK